MAEPLSRLQPRPVAGPGHRAAVREAALTGDWRLLVLQPAAGRRRQDAGCRTGLLRASPSCLLCWQLASLPLAASTAAETARENGMRTPTASRAAVGRGLHEWTWGRSHKALSPPHNSVIFRKIQWRSYWSVTRNLISQGKLSGCRIHLRVPRQTSVSIAAAFPAPRPSSQHSQSLGVDVLPQEQRKDTKGQGTQAWEPWRLWDPSPRSSCSCPEEPPVGNILSLGCVWSSLGGPWSSGVCPGGGLSACISCHFRSCFSGLVARTLAATPLPLN